MQTGIVSAGAYIPRYRLPRDVVAKSWERHALKGEKSVANTDEDSLTMAVAAAVSCLGGTDATLVDAVYFASTRPAYDEKSQSGMVATVCDLPENTATADFSNTPRAGASILKAALDAVAAKSARRVLATAGDTPLAYPKSDQEQLAGDAGAAALVGTDDLAAVFCGYHAVNTEILDAWRMSGEKFCNSAEARFATDKGYMIAMPKAVKGLLAKAGLEAKDIAKVAFTTPGLRENQQVAKKLGFAPEQIEDSLMLQVGYCAAAQPLLLLTQALENSAPGQYIVLAAYGNGAEAFLFKTTDLVGTLAAKGTVKTCLAAARPLTSYSRYLSFREILEPVPGEPFRTFPSTAAYWREQKSILRFYGSKCSECGVISTPVNRICPNCTAKDKFTEIRLADRKAKVFTFSIDNLAGRSDDPVVVQTVCEDAEGTRYYLFMTDFDAKAVSIGMEVEFTFRKVYVGGNYINYYWKCRPVGA